MRFDGLTEKLQCECLTLNDLLLEVNNTTFQIDSLIVVHEKIYFYEVKNFIGDYFYQSDKLFKKPNLEVINPLHQISRSESLLRQLLLSLGIKLQIEASVVFINPEFTLYQAPRDQPFIFPTQINRYMKHFNAVPSKLTEADKKIADRLLSLHITDSPFKQVPSYDIHKLRKGITCLKCESFSVKVEKRKCVCGECGYKESVTNAVMRSVREFKILFPDEKVTTNSIAAWCKVVEAKQTIRRILAANFNVKGEKQWTYYE
ncbi:nuclease-related domain-containing protein [Virgibacillus sp. 179-BFC.A HS]|uniref:Nuclease-related domain-containing protein n=1 Tax=Tigheibacillus jepli TaxID=3035914 RepID=A0ABU5CFR8_9BACI|nr:nuclease-related domain-containing protein [Virgibacillus sp. 179-BFC.A HS]MDY0404846.1 nuclease-related domain-containing protein [Virgibacillus sp. 179-BFC.A HS]